VYFEITQGSKGPQAINIVLKPTLEAPDVSP
jgi:hypothetical protein